jgi:hypothetical protein
MVNIEYFDVTMVGLLGFLQHSKDGKLSVRWYLFFVLMLCTAVLLGILLGYLQ